MACPEVSVSGGGNPLEGRNPASHRERPFHAYSVLSGAGLLDKLIL